MPVLLNVQIQTTQTNTTLIKSFIENLVMENVFTALF